MLWICNECTTAYAPGQYKCPHCGTRGNHRDEGEDVPKISKGGGPSWEGHEGLVEDGLGRVSEIDPDHQGRHPLLGEPTEKADDGTYTGDVRAKPDGDEQDSPATPDGEQPAETPDTDADKGKATGRFRLGGAKPGEQRDGGDRPFPGSSSSTSAENSDDSSRPSGTARRSRARTTENP